MRLQHIAVFSLASLVAACGGGSSGAPAVLDAAPDIGDIADQSIEANVSSAPIRFTVSDEDVGRVTVIASADRPELVPDEGLVLSGSGSDRTLVATPAPDVTGETTVTVTAVDAGLQSASTSFLVSVVAQQRSMQQFARDTFASGDAESPSLVNAVEFSQDADDDDFADLFAG